MAHWPHYHVTHWPHYHVTHWPHYHVTHWPHYHVTHWPHYHVTHWPHYHVTHWPIITSPTGPIITSPTGPIITSPTGPIITSPTGPIITSPTGPIITSPTGPIMFFQLKVRLNIHYFPSNGFHILRSYFKFTYSVAFSEKPEIDDVIEQGLSRGMSHQIAIVIRSYHGRVILTTVDIKCMFQHIFKIFLLTPHEKSTETPMSQQNFNHFGNYFWRSNESNAFDRN